MQLLSHGRRSLFVRYGHGRTSLLTQQWVSVSRNLVTKLLIEIGNPKKLPFAVLRHFTTL